MKLSVIGATGGVGLELVKQALAQGHSVTAFARFKATEPLVPSAAINVAGDVMDPGAVFSAVSGQEAVFCTLGAPLGDKSQVRARGTANIISAMQRADVSRLICVSALGVGDSWNLLPWPYRYVLVPLFMRRLYADHAQQEQYIAGSGLDWTIVRPGVLGDGPKTGSYRVGFTAEDRPSSPRISRADVADFMLRQVTSTTLLGQRPCLAY